jgi:shikimate kinase
METFPNDDIAKNKIVYTGVFNDISSSMINKVTSLSAPNSLVIRESFVPNKKVVYIDRRQRNNESARKWRDTRKRLHAERMAKFLLLKKENEALKKRLDELVVEVNEARIFARQKMQF